MSNPVEGFAAPYAVPGAGTYSGGSVAYQVLPFREGSGGRVYSGLVFETPAVSNAGTYGVQWPAWTATPAWVTGYSVLRRVNGAANGYRDVLAATMWAGWVDGNTGWSAAGELPCDFAHPPTVAKVLWNVASLQSQPETMDAGNSPLGGIAYHADGNRQLTRMMTDDLRRSVEGTFAFWVSPDVYDDGLLALVRGASKTSYNGAYSNMPPNFTFGDFAQLAVEDAQAGDWYLIVMRNNPVAATLTLDLFRLRDRQHISVGSSLSATPLLETDNFLSEGILCALGLGGSCPSGYSGPGYYDRIGIWNRVLSDAEVVVLFNHGLGWKPD